MDYKNLKKNHPKLYRMLTEEQQRQQETLDFIASENIVSKSVLEALATEFTNKYAEGKSHMRYYFGNGVVDEMEDHVKDLALKAFKVSPRAWGINIQPYSGSTANLAVYHALLKKGESVLAMHLDHGGHLTHGHKASITGAMWDFMHYGVDHDGHLDYNEIARLARKLKPKLIVCGGSAYPRTIDFKKFHAIAKAVDAYLMADISHIAGLIVGGVHPSPFPYADIVTTTTHKTLRGPRAALIISKKEIADDIDKAVFPGTQGGPHLNTIFAMGVALEEAMTTPFKRYARQIVKNTATLARELQRRGFTLVADGTDNHLLLIDLTQLKMTGKEAGELLEQAGIIANKNVIPYDVRKPWDPSGIRLGTPSVTSRGMKEKEMKLVAQYIRELLIERVSFQDIKKKVTALALQFPCSLTA
jgi:glycine hydroxymethyltransferase